MTIKAIPIRVTTTGSAGSATGTGDSGRVISGLVRAVYLDFNGATPGTTDTTLRTKGTTTPTYDLLVVTNSATDAFIAIASEPVDSANSAITNSNTPWPVADFLEVSVAQSDALTDAVVAHVIVEE